MKISPCSGLLISTLVLLSLPALAAAQMNFLWNYPTPSPTYPLHYFCGAANMDNDAGDELVYYSQEDRIVILDGATGAVEWTSGDWNDIRIAGAMPETRVYGYSPFCDVNGDGKKEISFSGDEFGTDDWKVYVVGSTGSGGVNQGGFGIVSLAPPLAPSSAQTSPPLSTVSYELTAPGDVLLSIFNQTGEKICTLEEASKPAGEYLAIWEGKDESGAVLPRGTYFYQLRVGDYVSTLKSILLK